MSTYVLVLSCQSFFSVAEWSKTMKIPDESVIPTLARISQYQLVNQTWIVEQNNTVGEGNQFQNWMHQNPCRGRYRRQTCVLSLMDLPTFLYKDKIIGRILDTLHIF